MRILSRLVPLALFALLAPVQGNPPTYPSWWDVGPHPVLDPNIPESSEGNHGAANIGQLKNIAAAAVAEFDAHLPGQAGDVLHLLVNSWDNPTPQADNHAAVNIGQLKAVAMPFYDRLHDFGYASPPLTAGQVYPWTINGPSPDSYALANIGQLKNVFSFDLSAPPGQLPDWWQKYYFNGQTGIDPNDDPDGDGWTNAQEAVAGSAPNDYYNGCLPSLAIVSGGDQRAAPGADLTVPFSVSVNNNDCNAPITFTVTSGSALLSATSDSASTQSITVVVRSNSTCLSAWGYPQNVAQVYIHFANNIADLNVITATATSGTSTVSINTTAATIYPTLMAPTSLTAAGTSRTTAELAWTTSDPSQPTTIQASIDGGATWFMIGAVSAGVNSTTITGMTPDACVDFRVITGNVSGAEPSSGASLALLSLASPGGATSCGSAPSAGAQAQPLSHPILKTERTISGKSKYGFKGCIDNTKRYLKKTITSSLTKSSPYSFPEGSATVEIITERLDGNESRTVVSETYDGAFHTSKGYWGEDYNWEAYNNVVISSDTSRSWNWTEHNPDNSTTTGSVQVTLENEYTHDMFYSDVENGGGDFEIYGGNDAWLSRSDDDTIYYIHKLRYRFLVNKDPNGSVTWDVRFQPDDGSVVQHEIHTEATNGAVEVPSSPIVIDPANYPALNPEKKDGTYYVVLVPVEIQVRDFSHTVDSEDAWTCASELNVNKWKDAFTYTDSPRANFIDDEATEQESKFRIRLHLKGLTEADRTVFISSSEAVEGEHNDDPTKVVLLPSPDGEYVQSEPMILVADTVDNTFNNNNQDNDHTHIVALGSSLEIRHKTATGMLIGKLPVRKTKTVNLDVKVLWQGSGDICPPDFWNQAKDDIKVAQEIYAQAGVYLNVSMHPYKIMDPAINFSDGLLLESAEQPGALQSEGQALLSQYTRVPGQNDVVCLYLQSSIFARTTIPNIIGGIAIADNAERRILFPTLPVYWHDSVSTAYNGTFLVAGLNPDLTRPTLAHELGHCLNLLHTNQDVDSHCIDDPHNIMTGKVIYYLGAYSDSKRMQDFQQMRIYLNKYMH